jgi:hypothetical protein
MITRTEMQENARDALQRAVDRMRVKRCLVANPDPRRRRCSACVRLSVCIDERQKQYLERTLGIGERRKPVDGPRVAFERLPEPGSGRAVDHAA